MQKFTPEEAERIIRESRETLSRPLHSQAREEREDCQVAGNPPVVDSPIESRMDRDRRELAEQDRQFARERRQRQREQEKEQRERWNAACKIDADQRVAELEGTLADVVRSTVTAIEGLENEIAHATSENRELRARLATLEARLADMQSNRVRARRSTTA